MSDLKLVHIYTAPNQVTAELIKGLLESNNIKVLIKANPGPEGVFMGTYGTHAPFNPWLIYVLKDKEREALKLIGDFYETRGE